MTKEIRFRLIGDDLERVLFENTAQPTGKPKVEIVTTGTRSLVFVNGQRINGVMDIQLPVRRDEISPQVIFKIHADEIVQRTVSSEEYARLASA